MKAHREVSVQKALDDLIEVTLPCLFRHYKFRLIKLRRNRRAEVYLQQAKGKKMTIPDDHCLSITSKT